MSTDHALFYFVPIFIFLFYNNTCFVILFIVFLNEERITDEAVLK